MPLPDLDDSTHVLTVALSIAATLAAALVASWGVRRGLARMAKTADTSVRAAYYTVGRVCHYLLVAVALTIAVGLLGVDLSRFTLLVSAVGVGIGFGMQSLIGNFVSGLIILFERHLKVGDFVELESGVTGEVRAISIRATRITTNDNIDVLVPTSEFVNGRVVNWTFDDVSRRVRVKFGVSYRASKATVRDVVLAAAAAVPFTRDDPAYRPQVWLVGFGESSLDFELVVWLRPDAVKRPATVHAAYCWAIDDALREAGIEIPFSPAGPAPAFDFRTRGRRGPTGGRGQAKDAAGKTGGAASRTGTQRRVGGGRAPVQDSAAALTKEPAVRASAQASSGRNCAISPTGLRRMSGTRQPGAG
jgi:small-conductance mechanosensitive channel